MQIRHIVIALIVGWLIPAALISISWWIETGALVSENAASWDGSDIQFLAESGRHVDSVLIVDRFVPRRNALPYLRPQGWAIVSLRGVVVDSAVYDYFSCRCRSSNADVVYTLNWRTVDEPSIMRSVQLLSGPGGLVRKIPWEQGWLGNVIEFGLTIDGPQDTRVEIGSFALFSDSVVARIKELWSAWMIFLPWQTHSINRVDLEADYRPIPLVPAVAACTALSILAYFGLAVTSRRRIQAGGIAAIVLVGWFALDARWSLQLLQQTRLTWHTYAGLDLDEKQRVTLYGPIYDLSEKIHASMPSTPRRLFMVTDEPDARFLQERLAYHLLPHNVFNFKRRFGGVRNHARDGDFLLVLGEVAGLHHIENETPILHWHGRGRLCAERVLVHPIGSLYRVCEN